MVVLAPVAPVLAPAAWAALTAGGAIVAGGVGWLVSQALRDSGAITEPQRAVASQRMVDAAMADARVWTNTIRAGTHQQHRTMEGIRLSADKLGRAVGDIRRVSLPQLESRMRGYTDAKAGTGLGAVGAIAGDALATAQSAWNIAVNSSRHIMENELPAIRSRISDAEAAALDRATSYFHSAVEHAYRYTNQALSDIRGYVDGRVRSLEGEDARIRDQVIPGALAPVHQGLASQGAALGLLSTGLAATAATAANLARCLPRCGTGMAEMLRDAGDDLGGMLAGMAAMFAASMAIPGFREALEEMSKALVNVPRAAAEVFVS